MRNTFASERVRAFAERRKCCAIVTISVAYASYIVAIRRLVKCQCIAYGDIYHLGGGLANVTEKEWEDRVKTLLKVELKRKNVTYAELAGKLADIGVMDSEPNIRNKISRGKFTAVFLVQCLSAIGVQELRL
ncbi:DUF6471 domain-containing protein [Qipengyuania atrilutea]|uniref:DUF6471 domain-containing protein n=1 Tax=Qipengyuania atrilutea TaxID=2744473 RepID=UPI001CEC84CE